MGSNLDVLMTLMRTEGPGAVVRRLVFRFRHIHTFLVMRLRLTGNEPPGQFPPGVEFKEVTPAELDRLREGRTDLPEYFYRDQTQTLERCWVGLNEGRLAFIFFLSLKGSSGMVRVGPTEAELAFIYCLEELRGKRMSTNAVREVGRTLYKEGITAFLAVPNQMNPPMVKSFEACGLTKIAEIKRYGIITRPSVPLDCSKIP
jgi:hypothetical protein